MENKRIWALIILIFIVLICKAILDLNIPDLGFWEWKESLALSLMLINGMIFISLWKDEK